MKERTSLVSNSSSSSFICSICGQIEAAMDASLEDMDMVSCLNGHELHKDCLRHGLSAEDLKILDDVIRLNRSQKFPIEYCPACKLECLSDEDEVKYLRKRFNITSEQVLKEVKDKFGNFTAFCKYLKDSENDTATI